jgi:hypothetical protein
MRGYPVALLDTCYLRLERSQEHLKALNDARAGVFAEGDASFHFTLIGKPNSHRTKLLFHVSEMEQIATLRWGMFVGDAVHSLRSALDHLVFAAASEPTRQCAFPICKTAKEWAIESPGILWSVPDDLRALIDNAQPYHRGDSAHAHPLAVLNTLWNLDKHRTIPVTAFVPVLVEWGGTNLVGIESTGDLKLHTRRALEPGAVIAEILVTPDDSGLEPQMDMDCHFLFEVAFGKGGGIPSSIELSHVVKTFNESLGSYVFQLIRSASEILEPGIERPLSVGGN